MGLWGHRVGSEETGGYCHENPMNDMKIQKDRTPEDESSPHQGQ